MKVCARVSCRRDRHALTVMRNHWRRIAETPRHREQTTAQLILLIYGTDTDKARFDRDLNPKAGRKR